MTVAKNELGTKENKNNFAVDENDEEHPYTRYGHLYEDMYGDWNNYFTGYVLKYANVQMSYDKDASKWQNKTIHDQKEEGEEGNVVFFRNDEGELRTGIVTSIDDLKKEIRVIEGDVEGEVKEERVNKDKVIAYLNDQIEIIEEDTPLAGEELEKKEENKITQTAKDEAETVEVTATYTEEANIPEGAQLTVTKLEDAENGNPRFDIGFYVGQEEVEPNAEVEISIKYLDEKLDGSEIVDYIHYKKDGSTETISSDVKALEDGSVETTFKTDSFSVFEAEIIVGVKKVEIEGADGEVEIGTEVTLTADAKGYKEDEKLYYQWQFNPVGYINGEENSFDENEPEVISESEISEKNKTNEKDWYDIKAETSKKYTFQLTYENQNYLWRVKVDNKKIKEDDREYVEKTNVGPVGEMQLIKPKKELVMNWFTSDEKEETDSKSEENDNNTLVVSEDIDLNTFAVNKTPYATYSGNSNSESLTDIPHDKTIEHQKNDDYRLYLDFGPTAGSKPMDLIVIIDVSGSMDEEDRLDNVIKTLVGETTTKWSSGYRTQQACEVARKNTEGSSGSCFENYNHWYFTITETTNGSEGLIKQFLTLNEENRISFGTFSSSSGEYNLRNSGWYQGENQIDDANSFVSPLEADGGTNYINGLKLADQMLESANSNHTKHVLFLTDGMPTEAYKLLDNDLSWLNGTINVSDLTKVGAGYSDKNIPSVMDHTIRAIKHFHQKYSDVDVTTIGYDLPKNNDEDYEPLLAKGAGGTVKYKYNKKENWNIDNNNKYNNLTGSINSVEGLAWGRGQYFKYTSNMNFEELIKQFELAMRGPRCTALILSDTLSDYVDFNTSDVDIMVKAIPGEGQTSNKEDVIFHYKGAPTGQISSNQQDVVEKIINGDKTGKNKEKDYHFVTEINPKVSINGKKIELTFDNDWELDPTYRYELSFNIQVTKDAYIEYDKNDYLHVGDENSDYRENTTSSNQPGFYSNMLGKVQENNAAFLSFEYNNELYTTENGGLHKYQKPVVQVQLKEVEMVKTDDNDSSLAKAEFDLYVDDERTLQIPGSTAKGSKYNAEKAYVSAQNGEISFGELKSGTYYLVETKAPDGFNLLANTYKLEVTTQGVTYYQVKVENGGEVMVGESKKAVPKDGKYILRIANEPGQSLPNTGGAGTKLFTFSGGAIIAASSLMYGYKKRSKRNKTGKGGK